MKKKWDIKISQSLVKEMIKEKPCYKTIKLGFIDQVQTTPTDAMLNGLYFEHHLIGGTRDGIEPVLPKSKSGAMLKRETDILELVERAKPIMDKLRIKPLEVQPHYKSDKLSGHLDLIADVSGEKAIVDVKWTGLDLNNKWNGWKDIDKQYPENVVGIADKLIQPLHYVELMYQITGEMLPFYFLVFNKSGGCKFIRVLISEVTLDKYRRILEEIESKLFDIGLNDFSPAPEYNKCRGCFYKHHCNTVSFLPDTEEVII